jgi:hypothetical protein
MSGTPELDALLAEHREPVADVVLRLREVLLEGRPSLVERVRPGWHSVNLPDPHHRLGGTGRRVRTLEFCAPEDVDAEVVLEFLDHAADSGARTRRRKVRS